MNDTEPTTPAHRWHAIHSFVDGFGWRHDDGRTIWTREAAQLPGPSALNSRAAAATDDEWLDEIYRALRPWQHARDEEATAWHKAHPVNFTKITLPASWVDHDLPDIRAVLSANPIKPLLDTEETHQ
jgi:hypothetical protein